jgi:hypothetical protein
MPSLSWIWSYLSGRNDVRVASSAWPTIRSTNGACTMNCTPTETTELLTSRRGTRHDSDTPAKPCGGSSSSPSFTFIETPAAVQGKLEELQVELDQFPVQALSTYHYVQQQQRDATMSSKDFLTNLKLLMLRSEHWVASNAASRLLRFLDAKLQWFGQEALSRPLLPMTITTTTPATVASDRSGFSSSNNRILDHVFSGIFQVLDLCETKQARKVLVIFPERARAVVGTGTGSLLELVR